MREGLRRFQENPGEPWAKLIQEGIIDNEGKVLVRMPEPPRKKKAKKPPKSTGGNDQRG